MKKYVGILLVLSILTMTIAAVDGQQNNEKPSGKGPKITIDPITKIGKAEFIHWDKNVEKDIITTTNPISGPCYATFATWNGSIPVNYIINPKNKQGLSEAFIKSAISTSAETWDVATGKELFNDAFTISYNAKWNRFDGKNVIGFGYYSPGVIAVTYIWFNSVTGQIYEFGILFNQIYAWGDATVNPSRMDLQNIATHEIGHGAGLDDIYSGSCSDVTMFGYSGYGETSKRTLEAPDITGLLLLYPNP